MIELPRSDYRTILADPPWTFSTWSDRGLQKNAQAHYRCMTLDDIKGLPVREIAADDCLIWMWATFPMLREGIETLEAWGARYVTGGAWAKQSSTGRKWAFGTGYVLRGAAEIFLVGAFGKPPILSRRQRNLIVAPVREHSRKPDDQYRILEEIGEAPRCELFARSERPGWDQWGDQHGRFEAA